MNPTRALKRIRELVRNGDYVVTAYCAARMWQRSIGRTELAIVEIQAGVVVVTVYRGDEDEG